jgi:hypothetical protein
MNEKIKLDDSMQVVMLKMSEGNIGALTVIMQLLSDAGSIDPDNFMPGLGEVLSLDTIGIYGSKIWMLYKDVCHENMTNLCAVLRACQLGFIDRDSMLHAIDNMGEGLDVPGLLVKVKERLPNFGNA